MMKKWIPIILCGGLLAGSIIAFAANDAEAPPSLSSVYNLAVKNELSPQDVALAYVHVLIAQRKMELTQAHISFVKKEAKETNGVFHHANEDTQESVEGSLDLTQADSFAAQAEYQANLNDLNQLVGKAYTQVKPLANDAIAANLDPQLKMRYAHMMDEMQQLQNAQASGGQIKSEALIQKEQDLYTAQQNYWDDVQIYLISHIKAEGAPAVIADLQENPATAPQNHWAVADPRLISADNQDKVAELASDVQKPSAVATLKATRMAAPEIPTAHVTQIELAARAVPPISQVPSQPVIPQPEPSVNSATLETAPVAKLAVQDEVIKPARIQNKTHAKKLAVKQPIHHRSPKIVAVKSVVKPRQVIAVKTIEAPQLAASMETFHDYILPEPTTTNVKLSELSLPEPQSTKFEYV